jgi:ubiquinone/menaquinone biosynthesis C-methylase UbiE
MAANPENAARERSRAVWDDMATGWELAREDIWANTQAVGEWLVRALDLRPGDTVLELAAGLGDTGFQAARRVGASGNVLITDFAPAMVAAARRRAAELDITNAEFRVLDAEHMDLATDSVDGAVCRWGYMLMIDPGAAFAETRRVLRPGGRLAFSVFAAPQHNPWASLIGRILVARGHLSPPDPTAPGIFALADPDHIQKLVTRAGFAAPEIDQVPVHWRFADPEAYWHFLTEMAGAISPVLRSLPPEEQSAVRAQLREAITPFKQDGGYDLPGLCLNAVTS